MAQLVFGPAPARDVKLAVEAASWNPFCLSGVLCAQTPGQHTLSGTNIYIEVDGMACWKTIFLYVQVAGVHFHVSSRERR